MQQSKCYKKLICALVLFLVEICTSEDNPPPPCSSEIYCYGRLLNTVQMAKTQLDSKTFVDRKLKKSPNETLNIFDEFMAKWNGKPDRFNIIQFINDNFEEAGMEFEDWTPDDWKPNPSCVNAIKDPDFKKWFLQLHDVWKELGRKMTNHVKEHQDLYSIIWVPNPVIVPGGRFREFYYWDSYWIIQGLLLSEMKDTVKGMLENFLYIIDKYGYIPNGGRVYYIARSQPPLFIPMVQKYMEFTNDVAFVKEYIHLMEKEFDYWMTNHTKIINKDGVNYTLATYGDRSYGPRPESYVEDVESASVFKDDPVKVEAFYSELKAGAESGWDFSSRWFIANGTNKGNFSTLKTRSIVPVDLNAFLYWNAALLSEFHAMLNNTEKSIHYRDVANEWMRAVEAVLWHEETGSWLDYDLLHHVKRDYFYPSNISPLWTGCYNQTKKNSIVRSVLKYLANKNILYSGGVPATQIHTGEQWDYPNAWPPLQHLMIVGLNNTGNDHAVRLAYEIAENWVRSNYKAFTDTEAMFEKYDATIPGGHGGGGEYEIQKGFGWTNGVIMDLLWRYSDRFTVEDPTPECETEKYQAVVSSSGITSITTALIALLVSLTAGFIGVLIYKNRTQKAHPLLGDTKRPSTATYTKLKNIAKNVKNTNR